MIHIASVAVWIALLLAAWNTGSLGARWREERAAPAGSEWLVFGVGAALALACATLVGTLLRGGSPLAVAAAFQPLRVGSGYRVAAAWATTRGAPLAAAFAFSILAALALGGGQAGHPPFARRLAAAFSGAAAAVLGIGLLLAPPFALTGAPSRAYPLFLVHPGAAVAPLFALAAVVSAGVAVLAALAGSGPQTPEGLVDRIGFPALQVAWLAATLELLAEQVARGAVGLTTADALIVGGATAGPWLWLALGILVHRRVRAAVLGGASVPARPASALRGRALVAHAGVVLIVIAFALHIVGRRVELTLSPGTPVTVSDVFGRPWQFVSQGVSRFDANGVDVTALAADVTTPSATSVLMTTEQRQSYNAAGEPFDRIVSVRGVRRGALQALRVVLDSVGAGETASVKVAFVPLTVLWIPGAALVLITGIAALLSIRSDARTSDAAPASPPTT